MKEVRKVNELFICEECNQLFKTRKLLFFHVKKHGRQIYFDKWLKDKKDGVCKICEKPTEFFSISKGYKNGCCKKHINLYVHSIIKNSLTNNFGVENQYQRKDVKETCKQTMLKNWGVENCSSSIEIKKKKEKTYLEHFGVKNFNNREKSRATCLKLYGVEHTTQNLNIFNKGLKTRFLIHKYKDTDLTYQGSYELDFLENFYNKLDIKNGPSIKYQYNGKNKVYHSDFYIPSKNLIIEIKSSWTLTLDTEIIEKKKATIANGFNYMLILDKNYKNL